MNIFYSTHHQAYLAQWIDLATKDLRTIIAPTRQEALDRALSAIFN